MSKHLPTKRLTEQEQVLAAEQDQVLIDYVAGLGDPSHGILTLYHGAEKKPATAM